MPHGFVFSTSPLLPSTISACCLLSQHLFDGFFGTMNESDSSQSYMHGLRLHLPVPPTCLHQTEGNCEVSRLPLREFPYMPGSPTARSPTLTRLTSISMLPSTNKRASALRFYIFSLLNGRPACAPVNASPAASRLPTHDSGSTWVATPSLWSFFLSCSLTVYAVAP
jgi:hypothetical protein